MTTQNQPAKLSKRIRYAKPGDTIVVPMGMIYPHAVTLESVYSDEDGQICGDGVFVERPGCSRMDLGHKVGVCLGWN